MSGQSDEGVDMSETKVFQSSKCPHYIDCTCLDGYNDEDDIDDDDNDDDSGGNSTNESIHSGSEFEEFIAVKGIVESTMSNHLCHLKEENLMKKNGMKNGKTLVPVKTC